MTTRRSFFAMLAGTPLLALRAKKPAGTLDHLILDPIGHLMCRDCYSQQCWEAETDPLRFFFIECHSWRSCKHSYRDGAKVYKEDLSCFVAVS